MRTKSERRAQTRLSVKDRALIVVGEGKENVFHLLDISRNGAGFRYLGKKNRTDGLKRVDLYFKKSIWLGNVKVQLIRDIQVFSGMIPFRRCGLRFAELTKEQSERLEQYVEQVASVEV